MSILNKFRTNKQKTSTKEYIIEHLCDLLNTKQGFGAYPKDLGLDSYIYLGSDQKIVLHIIADIKGCFTKYEKRISHIDVIPKESESRFLLSFMINCKIENKEHSFQLNFHPHNKSYSIEVEQ